MDPEVKISVNTRDWNTAVTNCHYNTFLYNLRLDSIFMTWKVAKTKKSYKPLQHIDISDNEKTLQEIFKHDWII
jgi:hypothetical protein